MNSLRIALAQINTTVGDLEGNRDKILQHMNTARDLGCDIVSLPEMSITGYPPEDLVLRKHFIQDQKDILKDIAGETKDILALIGFVDADKDYLYNAAAAVKDREIHAVYHKVQLPNYSVFDEERYFEPGNAPLVLDINGIQVGVSICEDIWAPNGVIECEAFTGGAEILINISASPFTLHKNKERLKVLQQHARKTCSVLLYNNLVGGQDELVFDGQSLLVNEQGELLATGKAFEEDFLCVDVNVDPVRRARQHKSYGKNRTRFTIPFRHIQHVPVHWEKKSMKKAISAPTIRDTHSIEEQAYKAITLGLRDYVHKNGFKQVVFGLSGGIDSALVAVIAADALGPEHVTAVLMPSQYSSKGSVTDSEKIVQNLGIHFYTFPVRDIFQQYLDLFRDTFQNMSPDITEENLQARIRGNIIMALSNKFGYLALATGNKSEVSVGYCTLYGDMVGGFSPLKDLQKNMVYRLSHYRNDLAGYPIIPQSVIDKEPSAELKPDQKDQDSLPPYEVLDKILTLYVEESLGVREIIERGFHSETVKKVTRMVDMNEYKRRQAAPGVKITSLAFGKDRRMPITNKYSGF